MSLRLSLFFSLVAAGVSAPLAAQSSAADATLEAELFALLNAPIQGASKREQKLLDSPQAIEVLTAEDIRTSGAFRLEDVLKLMTSIDVIELDQASYVGLRGVMQQGLPRTVQILIDGVPFYNANVDAADINNLPLPVALIERIEVVRGPSSTLYGANAVAGVIAITTKQAPEGLSGDLCLGRANRGTSRWSGSALYASEPFSVTAGYSGAALGATHRDSFQINNPSVIVPLDNDRRHQRAYYLRPKVKVGDATLWASLGEGVKRTESTAISLTPWDEFRNRLLQVGWSHEWSPSLSSELRFNQTTLEDTAGPSPLLAMVLANARFRSPFYRGYYQSNQAEVQLNWNPAESFHLVAGADSRRYKTKPNDVLPKGYKESASGGFVSADWSPVSSLTVSGGIRAENESLGGARTSPRATAVWRPTDSSSLRVGYYASTRSPQVQGAKVNMTATLPSGGIRIQADPNLEPEKITSFEIGFRQNLGAFSYDLSLYRMKFNKLIQQVVTSYTPGPPPLTVSEIKNSGSATNNGAELAVTWLVKTGWSVGGNISWIDYTSDQTGQEFSYAPKLKYNLWTRYHGGRWTAYLAFQHLDKAVVESMSLLGVTALGKRDAVNQVHAHLNFNVFKGLSVGVYAQNAVESYTDSGAGGPWRETYMNAGRREFGVTVGYRF